MDGSRGPSPRRLAWTLPLVALALCGCSVASRSLGVPEEVATPGAAGSQAPNLALGLDGNVYLSWIEPSGNGHALRFSIWTAGAWSEPRTVAEGRGWFVNWADFPSMAALEDGTLAAHWLVRSGAGTYSYDVVIALSHDGGDSWSEPLVPHHDDTPTEHGFVSLFPTSEDQFGVVWLDGRNTARTPPGPMTLRYATLRVDGTLDAEAQIDESVCDCCSTDAVFTDAGSRLAVYRDRTASEIRDISVSRRERENWSPPRTVHEDHWEIAACPVNGPAVAARGKLVATAWFHAAEGIATVQVAFSEDHGSTFGRPVRVDHGDPLGRVDVVLLDDGSALVSWLEQAGEGARIVLRRARPTGALESTLVAATSRARSSGFPRMERLGDRVFLAWTVAGEPSRIATAVLSM